MLEVEEEIDTYRCCEEKSGYVKLVRLESGPSSQEGTCASWLYLCLGCRGKNCLG